MKQLSKSKKPLVVAAIAALITTGTAVAAASANPPTKSTESVQSFATPGVEVGTSTLTRTDTGMRLNLRTSGTAAKEALTVWWVVFNHPEACSAPGCGTDDIFVDGDPAGPLNEVQIESADIVAAYATGKVSSQSGHVTFSANLDADEPAGTREVIFGSGSTLKHVEGAEVHLVVRSHGPAVFELVQEQIGSFAGGCEVFLAPPAVPTAEGECGDTLFAIHRP